MYGSLDMRAMTKVHGDAIKPECTHTARLCSTIHFLEQGSYIGRKEVQAGTKEGSGELVAKSDENERVELWPVIDIKISALHNMLTVRYHQQRAARIVQRIYTSQI